MVVRGNKMEVGSVSTGFCFFVWPFIGGVRLDCIFYSVLSVTRGCAEIWGVARCVLVRMQSETVQG